MNILVDLIILAIAGVTIFLAGKRGFIKTAVTAASSLIALVVVICFTGVLAGILGATPLADVVYNGTTSFVEELAENESIADLVQDEEGPLLSTLDKVGVDTEAFSDWAAELVTEEDEAVMREKIVEYVAEPVTSLVMKALSVLILYVGAVLLLKLAAGLLTGIVEKLPFVRQANTLLGLVLGCVLALVRVFIFCAVIGILASTADLTGWEIFASIDPAQTYLYRLFDAIQILQFLF